MRLMKASQIRLPGTPVNPSVMSEVLRAVEANGYDVRMQRRFHGMQINIYDPYSNSEHAFFAAPSDEKTCAQRIADRFCTDEQVSEPTELPRAFSLLFMPAAPLELA